jgi:hypothetical protein
MYIEAENGCSQTGACVLWSYRTAGASHDGNGLLSCSAKGRKDENDAKKEVLWDCGM